MANNYTETSISLYTNNGTYAKLGKIGEAIAQVACGGNLDSKGLGFISNEEAGLNTENVALAALDAVGIEYYPEHGLHHAFNLIHQEYPEAVTEKMLNKVIALLPDGAGGTEEYVWLGDVILALIDEPGNNVAAYSEESAYTCSKNRHGEFGGSGYFVSDTVSCHSNSANPVISGAALHYALIKGDLDRAANILNGEVNEVFNQIRDKDTQAKLRERVINQLATEGKVD